MFVAIVFLSLMKCSICFSSRDESLLELYKKLSSSNSLSEGLNLNPMVENKLKTMNTIRFLPITSTLFDEEKSIRLKINLTKLDDDEEMKLFQLRLKLRTNITKITEENVRFFVRKDKSRRRIFPRKISAKRDDLKEMSFDLTEFFERTSNDQWLIIRNSLVSFRCLEQISLIVFTRTTKNVFFTRKNKLRTKRSIKTKQFSLCQREDFQIDFNEVPFGNWIVEPKTFNAGICRGDCRNPLSPSFYPSNHAMLLSLLFERGTITEKPSCVPIRFQPLDLLYYDQRQLVIKRHQTMKVEECACR